MKSRSTLIVRIAGAVLFAGLAAGYQPAVAAEPYARHDPATFEERMKNEQAFVVNVHIPYEGELDGTDAFIPYDKIKGDPRLPADKGTEILLYCKSGRMSEEAGADLHEEGYTNIAHLEGGMKAWEASGRKVTFNPEHAAQQGGGAPHPM
ncbi:MAG TPA: rhodanese-like domain-containing protein [Acidimicrobiia bacterium]|nr:rhodanese-like domain-containing protein [Acidimicrobiia bacterium]